MGTLSAIALQDEELNLSLEDQVAIHLATNIFPKPPAYMVDIAIEALDCVNNGEGHLSIKMPEGVIFRGSGWGNTRDIVEAYRLGMWVVESELD